MNFIGNIEPKELLLGKTDVIIQDGFTGNVMIKTMEATVKMMSELIKREIKAGALTGVGGLLAKPAFGRVAEYASEETVGGAPLLGIDGVVIVGHGKSTPTAIMNAILRAREAVDGDVINAIRAGVSGN
jgi:glycerol-3-phosphate acyltransferase PlsX